MDHLKVLLRVPVAVIDDAGVGGRQVDSQTSGSGGQQEDSTGRGFVEPGIHTLNNTYT